MIFLKKLIDAVRPPAAVQVAKPQTAPKPKAPSAANTDRRVIKKSVPVPVRVEDASAKPSVGANGQVERTGQNSRRIRVITPTAEMLQDFLSYDGRVLTARGGDLEITPAQAQYVAMLENKLLIVSRSHQMHQEVSSVRSFLKRKGLNWTDEYLVDLDVVRRLYERSEKLHANAATPRDQTVQMQREFLALISKAAQMRASDIHIVVRRYEAIIEVRVDSMITKLQDLTAGTALELCQAAFNMSDVSDPTYNAMEQQGSRVTETSLKGAKFPEGVQSIRLQFSPLPAGGRYMVARLLYDQKVGSNADIDELGYANVQIDQIKAMRRKPYGINVFSGPTGSGKSTTLQRAMTALMRERPGINVVTIEDPPEYVILGAKQIPVANAQTAEERKEKFRQAMTGALRLDPDVIMVGEIRDGASAHLGFEAAMTGHGLWTSLHSNDAVSNLDRLRDMGVEMFKLGDASLVTGLIGQRLVRRTAQETSVSFEEGVRKGFISETEAETIRRLAGKRVERIRFADTPVMTDFEKFSGRTVVAETILVDQGFLDLFLQGRKPESVTYWLEHLNGFTMLEHGFSKVCDGSVDPREIEEKIGLIGDIDPARVERVLATLSSAASTSPR
jgi:type II secretory ATPase GspE/PulE/Tfp pilus assembly ATPase PilB-like protein